MACIKDETLFDVLDDHAEELRSSSFQVPPSITLLSFGCLSRST